MSVFNEKPKLAEEKRISTSARARRLIVPASFSLFTEDSGGSILARARAWANEKALCGKGAVEKMRDIE
jgi:hypothetical protein